jgi:uridylate kinase
LAREVAGARALEAQIAVVVGGGNFVRGREAAALGWPQVSVDYMGMLATVVNGLALRESLEAEGVAATVLSAFGVGECCERYTRGRALALLAAGEVVVFVGGTGRPLFTTDTAAALRAGEIEADLLLKATDVDGVYDRDPKGEGEARRFDTLTYDDVLGRDLQVMDASAATLCRDHKIPTVVFCLYESGNIVKIMSGERLGTFVAGGEAPW